jgi:hypothetical protein
MTDAPANPNQPLLDRQLAMLSHLAEAALELALHLKAQAIIAEEPERLVTAFGRAARAVRLSLTLQAELLKDPAAATPKAPETIYIERTIVSPPERAGRDRPSSDRLDREIPDQPRNYPVREILALICKDIDLEADVAVLIEDAIIRKQAHGGGQGLGWGVCPQVQNLEREAVSTPPYAVPLAWLAATPPTLPFPH